MPKILHTAHYTGEPWEILKGVVPEDFTVETLDAPTRECLIRQAIDADYFLVSGRLVIDDEVLASSCRLKMIQRTGVGLEMLDTEAIRRRGIPVYVNRGVNARSVAEHTLALMLCSLKNIPQIDKNVKHGIWNKQQLGVTCHELYGKTVGLVGMGAIGFQVASYLNAFGANILYTDLFRLESHKEQENSLTFVPDFKRLLPQVDILSFHCPLTPENKEMLNATTMSLLKDGVIVINTARGQLINEQALHDQLVDGKIRHAALDVHYEEPISKDSPLLGLTNVTLTPHIAGLSYETFHKMMSDAVGNIVAFHYGKEKEISIKRVI